MDSKVVEYKRVFENATLREKTRYFHGATSANNYCVTQERQYYTENAGDLESAETCRTTNYAYNSAKYTHAPVSVSLAGLKDADGNSLSNLVEYYDYDPMGWMLSHTDPNGYTTRYEYDAMGRLVRESYPVVNGQQHSTSAVYNDTLNTVTTTDERGYKTRAEFYPLGLEAGRYLATGNTILKSRR